MIKLKLSIPSVPKIGGIHEKIVNEPEKETRVAFQPILKNEPGNLIVGIDPGTNTGLAVWDRFKQSFSCIASYPIHEALEIVKSLQNGIHKVIVERPPVNFGQSNQFRLQGAGSIKRDFSIWEDFLNDLKIPFVAIRPTKRSMTKLNKEKFTQLTKWSFPTNEHSRDAAMLVWKCE